MAHVPPPGREYDAKADIEQLMHKLMDMDVKLDEILERMNGEDDNEEEPA